MSRLSALLSLALVSAAAPAQLSYPEGSDIPRSMTAGEQKYVEMHGYNSPRVLTPPPKGDVWCASEYALMEGIVVAWEGSSAQNSFLVEIIRNVTSSVGAGIVYISVDDAAEQATVAARMSTEGIDPGKVKYIVATTDTIWLRDYGPRYIFQGGCRAIVDHIYNRPRPNDDAFPSAFAAFKSQAIYGHDLVHGGGNYHLDGVDRSYATRLIANENSGKSENEIISIWNQYQAVDTHLFDPFPTTVDSTQHLDMWMQVASDNLVVISDWPNNAGSVQDVICDNAAGFMQTRGYQVVRVPARSVSGVHYTYTNVVMCNGIVIIPSYTNTTVTPHNTPALLAWQQALPGKTIVQVNAQGIITSAGAMHCIVMHVPRPVSGTVPKAYLTNVNTHQIFQVGQNYPIEWVTDDDNGVVSCELQISRGSRVFQTIASGLPPNGSFTWQATGPAARSLLFRIRATDAQNNVGTDDSDVWHGVN